MIEKCYLSSKILHVSVVLLMYNSSIGEKNVENEF